MKTYKGPFLLAVVCTITGIVIGLAISSVASGLFIGSLIGAILGTIWVSKIEADICDELDIQARKERAALKYDQQQYKIDIYCSRNSSTRPYMVRKVIK